MRKVFYFIICFGLLQAGLSAQVITAEEVVMKGRTSLAPATYRQPAWIPGTTLFTWVEGENLFLYSSGSDSAVKHFTLNQLNALHQEQGLDSVRSFPLFNWVEGKIGWYQSGGNIVVFDLAAQTISLRNTFDLKAENTDVEPTYYSVAFTRGNNLFVSTRGTEIQVSKEEKEGIVVGQSVHRNEFGITKGTYWSPKGNMLAYYRMDESMVTTYPILDLNSTPATTRTIRYPMAGDTSHQVKVGVFSVLKQKTVWLATSGPADQYYTNITWSPDERFVYLAVLNRDQNHLKLQKYDSNTGALLSTLLEEQHEAYVEPQHGPILLDPSGRRLIWQSERTGNNHLYLWEEGKELVTLTEGNWDVLEVTGVTTSGDQIYFQASGDDGMSRHLSRVSIDSGKVEKMTNESGTHYSKVNLNTGDYLDIFSSVEVPRTITLFSAEGKKELMKAPNPLVKYDACEVRLLKFYTEDSVALNARMILPTRFDSSKTYPVLVYVYGGPHAQMVTDSWLGGADLWLYSMAQRGFIVFTLDNRGSGNRGKKFEQYTFRNLGEKEAEDQLIGVNYLKGLSYVDSKNLNVFGWSFGGFMTINLMTRYPGLFRKGVAGGPVCDWRMYEVMYTERYMDTPEKNPDGYASSNLMNRIGDLKGDLMLIHGTSDDVVLWQHSLLLQQNAVKKGIIMDYMSYPGHAHNVMGKDRAHLHRVVSRYFGLE
jgi:dipeptidyl-peptidase-4